MKRLLILGNGYYIGNDYKTSYKDFKQYIDNFEKYYKAFENKGRVKYESRESWHPATLKMFHTNRIDEYINETIGNAQINYKNIEFAKKFKKTSLYYLLNKEDIEWLIVTKNE